MDNYLKDDGLWEESSFCLVESMLATKEIIKLIIFFLQHMTMNNKAK